MAFDLIVPRTQRGGADQVKVCIGRSSKGRAPAPGQAHPLELRILIGRGLAERLGLKKGQRVNLLVGTETSADRGCIAIDPVPEGHFKLWGGGSLGLRLRSLHSTIARAEKAPSYASLVQVAPERLIVRLPEAFLVPLVKGGIMGQPAPAARKKEFA